MVKSVNNKYFEIINTEDKAYWLGFITADGCIYKRKNGNSYTLYISLSSKDEKHLIKFKNDIESEHLIYKRKMTTLKGTDIESVRIAISNQDICNDLIKLGITERKSLTCRSPVVPDEVPLELERHFWRGVIDGDGTIGWYKRHNSRKGKYSLSLVGSYGIVDGFRDYCYKFVDSAAKVLKRENIYVFTQTESNAIKMCSILYDDSCIRLERKFDIYKNYLVHLGEIGIYNHDWRNKMSDTIWEGMSL